jgi:hypothetical protein
VLDEITYCVDGKQNRIELVSDGVLRSQRAGANASGAPKYCTIRPKAADPSAVQTWEIAFYPTPDQAYTIEYWYNRTPDVSSEATYPVGTPTHAETLAASCLSVAELVRDGARGVMHERFMERLAASIALDKRSSLKRTPQE